MTSRSLVLVPSAGLCNRLQTLACARLLASDTRRRLFVNWDQEPGCAVDYEDLFVRPLDRMDPLPEQAVCYTSIRRKLRANLDTYARWLCGNPEERFRKILRDDAAVIVVITCHQFLSYFHDERFGPELRRLLPEVRPEIGQRVDAFSAREFAKTTVGVHVRRGDWGRQQDLDFYLNHMGRFPGATFYVSTDDPAVFGRIQARYPRSVRFSATEAERSSRDGMVLALIDLLLLSRCSYLIGTPGSSFSAMARRLGDLPGNFEYGLSLSMRDFRLGNLDHIGATLMRRAVRSFSR